ncbi:hypothetical protein BH24ACI3_BH24ACI3_06630 [soil metagenome]
MHKLIPILYVLAAAWMPYFGSNSIAATAQAVPIATPTPQTQQIGRECECPEIEVESNLETVKSGDNITFRLAIWEDGLEIPRLEWRVENGKIISGQGTSEVIVRAHQKGNAKAVNATVLLPVYSTLCVCPIRFSLEVEFGEESVEPSGYTPHFPPNIASLELSTDQLVLPCEPGRRRAPETPPESATLILDVVAMASNTDGRSLTYSYTVSGGTIIGTGSSVRWDSSGALPGTYSITAGVDDGCGFCGQTITKTVTVLECSPTCSLVECPSVELNAPDSVANSDVAVFSANVSGGPDVKYEWIVENGEIIEGQGTPVLKVRLPLNPSQNLSSVSFKLIGLHPSGMCIDGQKAVYKNGVRVKDLK